jgi:hypothetical protein
MKKSTIAVSLFLPLVAACSTVAYPLPGELSGVAPMPVSGRQGVMVNQRLSFGPYATGEVSRSATRGTDQTDKLDSHATTQIQRYAFALLRGGAKVADVECTAEGAGASTLGVTWESRRALDCAVTPAEGERHTLRLASSRDRPLAGQVVGPAGYRVAGSDRVGAGRVTGTAGYTLTRIGGPAVAAVDVMNDGAVYLASAADDVVAAVAAALLLYQDPLQASERFRDP